MPISPSRLTRLPITITAIATTHDGTHRQQNETGREGEGEGEEEGIERKSQPIVLFSVCHCLAVLPL